MTTTKRKKGPSVATKREAYHLLNEMYHYIENAALDRNLLSTTHNDWKADGMCSVLHYITIWSPHEFGNDADEYVQGRIRDCLLAKTGIPMGFLFPVGHKYPRLKWVKKEMRYLENSLNTRAT